MCYLAIHNWYSHTTHKCLCSDSKPSQPDPRTHGSLYSITPLFMFFSLPFPRSANIVLLLWNCLTLSLCKWLHFPNCHFPNLGIVTSPIWVFIDHFLKGSFILSFFFFLLFLLPPNPHQRLFLVRGLESWAIFWGQFWIRSLAFLFQPNKYHLMTIRLDKDFPRQTKVRPANGVFKGSSVP